MVESSAPHGSPHGTGKQAQSSKGHGKHDKVSAQKIDAVSLNKIWKEHCLKEDQCLKLSSQFSINPSTLVYIAEKPNKFKPSRKLTPEEIAEAKALLGTVNQSNDMDLLPTEKYDVPLTSSQEIGWCSRPLVEKDPFFEFPHKGCSITKFAAKYEECMHRSPYARRNPVDQHVAKSYANAGVNTSHVGSPSVISSLQGSSINSKAYKAVKKATPIINEAMAVVAPQASPPPS